MTPAVADPANYTQVWAFRSNGSLVQSALPSGYETLARSTPEAAGANPLIYLGLLNVFKPTDQLGPQEHGHQLLACGGALMVYENVNAVRDCLKRSISLIPDNSYPAYYLGQLSEKQGRLADAKRWYERAVGTDDGKAPTPAFKQAVERVAGPPRSQN